MAVYGSRNNFLIGSGEQNLVVVAIDYKTVSYSILNIVGSTVIIND